jgi:hypothetical protein
MSPERREHAHCNEHKVVPPDRQFHWCLSCYTIVLQDVVHNQRDRSIGYHILYNPLEFFFN